MPSTLKFSVIIFLHLLLMTDLSAQTKHPTIVLNDIYFGKEKFELQATSWKQLDQLAAMLQENHELKVKIAGHTDSKGDEEVNMNLSINRADAVKKYLIDAGVAHHRIKSVGYGEHKPAETNETEEGKEKNRRVTFRILEK